MNIFLKNNPNSKIGKLVEKIKNLTDESIFKNHVFLVGGVMRDFLIYGNEFDKKCNDVDIVVNTPDGGIAFATWVAYHTGCHMTNKNPVIFPTYGTAKFQILTDPQIGDIEIECVQTRKEKYNKETRNPSTAFGTIEEDAMRRDLTINALYYNISTDEICDYTKNGLDDIKNQILRCTGEPNVVFEDDPLRILRVVRFANRLGWKIEKNTWVGMIMNSRRISIVTQERATDEINKMLLSDKPSEAIKMLDRCNMLQKVLPAVSEYKHVYQDLKPLRSLYEHTLETLDKTPKVLETRLAALFHDIGKLETHDKGFMYHSQVGADMAEKVLRAMKYSNAVVNTVKKAVEYHEDFSSYTGGSIPRPAVIRKFVVKFEGNEDDLNVALDLIHCNNLSQMYGKKVKLVPGIRKKIEELDKKNESGKKLKIPISGNDIMNEFNIKPSVFLGTIMDKVKEQVIENPSATKEDLFKFVEEYLKKVV